ncbi:amidase 1 isoform X3 [Asparagus officinalis]|uniref:amidase 1 isoform X3 n=1 Tax=Asparagus officinalis TaxID=4686 RepID=UPI00098E685B|nr:amidase 1 isoform X3 [Asparagus officinalis]
MEEEYEGAFVQRFELKPPTSPADPPLLPLQGLTFAVKDIFDVSGHVTGFGNPDWARTHEPAKSTAPAVAALLEAGATCLGKTVMDELAYSINGENFHYGTPPNPVAPGRVPGGSSSGSAVAVAAGLVDFSLGWFARDPSTLALVARVLLPSPIEAMQQPTHVIIPEDCFQLLVSPSDQLSQILISSLENMYGCDRIKRQNLGNYVYNEVPSSRTIISKLSESQASTIPALGAVSYAMRSIQRFEFKENHGEWINTTKPKFGPGISERIAEAVNATDENIECYRTLKSELQVALTALLENYGVLAIPTLPGPPPKVNTEAVTLENFRAKAFCLLSIAGMSGFCQVTIPLGMHNNLPVSISLVAKHGADHFLLNLADSLYATMREQARTVWKMDC